MEKAVSRVENIRAKEGTGPSGMLWEMKKQSTQYFASTVEVQGDVGHMCRGSSHGKRRN